MSEPKAPRPECKKPETIPIRDGTGVVSVSDTNG